MCRIMTHPRKQHFYIAVMAAVLFCAVGAHAQDSRMSIRVGGSTYSTHHDSWNGSSGWCYDGHGIHLDSERNPWGSGFAAGLRIGGLDLEWSRSTPGPAQFGYNPYGYNPYKYNPFNGYNPYGYAPTFGPGYGIGGIGPAVNTLTREMLAASQVLIPPISSDGFTTATVLAPDGHVYVVSFRGDIKRAKIILATLYPSGPAYGYGAPNFGPPAGEQTITAAPVRPEFQMGPADAFGMYSVTFLNTGNCDVRYELLRVDPWGYPSSSSRTVTVHADGSRQSRADGLSGGYIVKMSVRRSLPGGGNDWWYIGSFQLNGPPVNPAPSF